MHILLPYEPRTYPADSDQLEIRLRLVEDCHVLSKMQYFFAVFILVIRIRRFVDDLGLMA